MLRLAHNLNGRSAQRGPFQKVPRPAYGCLRPICGVRPKLKRSCYRYQLSGLERHVVELLGVAVLVLRRQQMLTNCRSHCFGSRLYFCMLVKVSFQHGGFGQGEAQEEQ